MSHLSPTGTGISPLSNTRQDPQHFPKHSPIMLEMQLGYRFPYPYMVGMSADANILERGTWSNCMYHYLHPRLQPSTVSTTRLYHGLLIVNLALHLINAATPCVPVQWRSVNPPTIDEWHSWVDKTAEMKRLIHQAKDTHTKFRNTWACWTHYRDSLVADSPRVAPMPTVGIDRVVVHQAP